MNSRQANIHRILTSTAKWTPWNPTTGCTKVSDACLNCYAEATSLFLQRRGIAAYNQGFLPVFHDARINDIASYRHPRRIFVDAMSDLFHDHFTDAQIDSVLDGIYAHPQHIYFSIENNTIGEAALISIAEYGEERIQGYFLSEPAGGGSRRYRKGFNTTHKPKLAACNKLKLLIETGRMKIRSSSLVSELKTFVAAGVGYAAKIGETDDLVMSTVLAIRMLQLLQSYDTDINNQLRDHGDEVKPPMPFIAVLR
jgi:hypothetical protein